MRYVLTWEVIGDEGEAREEDASIFASLDEMTEWFNQHFGPYSSVMKRLYVAASDEEPALVEGVIEFVD
jgi:hypothetical protein